MGCINKILVQDIDLAAYIREVDIGKLVQFYDQSLDEAIVGMRCQFRTPGPQSFGVVALEGLNAGKFYMDNHLNNNPVLMVDKFAAISVNDPKPRSGGRDQSVQSGEVYSVNPDSERNGFAVAVFWDGTFHSFLKIRGLDVGTCSNVDTPRYVGTVGVVPYDLNIKINRDIS